MKPTEKQIKALENLSEYLEYDFVMPRTIEEANKMIKKFISQLGEKEQELLDAFIDYTY